MGRHIVRALKQRLRILRRLLRRRRSLRLHLVQRILLSPAHSTPTHGAQGQNRNRKTSLQPTTKRIACTRHICTRTLPEPEKESPTILLRQQTAHADYAALIPL